MDSATELTLAMFREERRGDRGCALDMKNDIGWTHGTRNPLNGCSDADVEDPETGEVFKSPICAGCWAKGQTNRGMSKQHVGLTVVGDAGPGWVGEVRCTPHILEQRIPKPRDYSVRRIFAPSMSDPFHESLVDPDFDPDLPRGQGLPTTRDLYPGWIDFTPERREYVLAMLGWMSAQPWVDWQVLTKRAKQLERFMREIHESRTPIYEQMARALEKLGRPGLAWLIEELRGMASSTPFENIIFGCTIENDLAARARLPHLTRLRRDGLVPHTFVSYEAALGRVDFSSWIDWIDWLIIGGASGNLAVPMHPGWARSAIHVAHQHGRPVFFKQWGEWSPVKPVASVKTRVARDDIDGDKVMYKVGRDAAGKRILGMTFFEWPCLRGEQPTAFAWLRAGEQPFGISSGPGHRVWRSRSAAIEADDIPDGATLFELELPAPYRRCVYARAEDETYVPEIERLRVDLTVGVRRAVH